MYVPQYFKLKNLCGLKVKQHHAPVASDSELGLYYLKIPVSSFVWGQAVRMRLRAWLSSTSQCRCVICGECKPNSLDAQTQVGFIFIECTSLKNTC